MIQLGLPILNGLTVEPPKAKLIIQNHWKSNDAAATLITERWELHKARIHTAEDTIVTDFNIYVVLRILLPRGRKTTQCIKFQPRSSHLPFAKSSLDSRVEKCPNVQRRSLQCQPCSGPSLPFVRMWKNRVTQIPGISWQTGNAGDVTASPLISNRPTGVSKSMKTITTGHGEMEKGCLSSSRPFISGPSPSPPASSRPSYAFMQSRVAVQLGRQRFDTNAGSTVH